MIKKFIILSMCLIIPFSVLAEDSQVLGEINEETTSNQVFYIDDDVDVSKDTENTIFAAGSNVTVTNKADGIAFIAGNNVNAKGESDYGFIAGNVISFTGAIYKDVFIAGNSINIGSDAKINRDAYIVGNSIKINSDIQGNLRVGGTSLDISGIKVSGKVIASVSELIMDENTIIDGTLSVKEDANIVGLDDATYKEKIMLKSDDLDFNISLSNTIYTKVMSLIAAFIVMVAFFYIMPKTKKKIDVKEITPKSTFSSLGKGIVVLIVVPFISIIALVTGFLTPIALITLALYIICIYLSTLISAYIIGKIIDDNFIKKENTYLTLIIGLILVKVVSIIPYAGELLTTLTLFYGLGLIYDLVKKEK